MNDLTSTFKTDLAGLEKAAWFDAIDTQIEDIGHFEPLGEKYAAAFIDAGPKLLVTFESYPDIAKNTTDYEPIGFRFARSFGWSILTIISCEESWYRDQRAYRYFDRLIDDGFFEDFDDVLFYGSDRGGYAAAAYSVAAPGARVLSIAPVATLDPAVAGWDRRFLSARRENFTDRYGYAPDMIDAAQQMYVMFDPMRTHDAMHAALFTKSNVAKLRFRHSSVKTEKDVLAMGIHDQLIEYAMNGDLNEVSYAHLMRRRREYGPYLNRLANRLLRDGRHRLAEQVCRFALRDDDAPAFKTLLKRAQTAA